MKVVLFCGGLGTRIREYSENVPKPMIPVGNQPILWHVMNYYSQYGHNDFVLCLGYKANVVKEFFLNYKPHIHTDCIVSKSATNIELIGPPRDDWRIALIDTGIWRKIGQRLWAVRDTSRVRACSWPTTATASATSISMTWSRRSRPRARWRASSPFGHR
jgi:glucose-1-phosphate cytidylyltransferase